MIIKSMRGLLALSIICLSQQAYAAAVFTFSGTVSHTLLARPADKPALLAKYEKFLQTDAIWTFEILVDPDRNGHWVTDFNGRLGNDFYDEPRGRYYADLLSSNIDLPTGLRTETQQHNYVETFVYESWDPYPYTPDPVTLSDHLTVGDGFVFEIAKRTDCKNCSKFSQSQWPNYRIEYWQVGDVLAFLGNYYFVDDFLGQLLFHSDDLTLINISGELPHPIPIPTTAWLLASAVLGTCGMKFRNHPNC